MVHVFNNLKLLRSDMIQKGWKIDSFKFQYKTKNFIVLVKLFDNFSDDKTKNVPKYALVQLEFLHKNDFTNSLTVYADLFKLYIDAKTLRDFFGIEWAPNLGNIITQFYEKLSEDIPAKVDENKSNQEKKAMCYILDKTDSKDPNRIYCYAIRRNPVDKNGDLGKRSIFNDNKTQLLRKTLYKRLGNDTNLSFKYSLNPIEEKSDEEIIINWTKNKK